MNLLETPIFVKSCLHYTILSLPRPWRPSNFALRRILEHFLRFPCTSKIDLNSSRVIIKPLQRLHRQQDFYFLCAILNVNIIIVILDNHILILISSIFRIITVREDVIIKTVNYFIKILFPNHFRIHFYASKREYLSIPTINPNKPSKNI